MCNVLFETLTLGRLLPKAKGPFLSMRQTNPCWEPNQIIKFQGRCFIRGITSRKAANQG